MGDVIDISRVTDTDIFSQFDDQCPQIPKEIDVRIPKSARKAVHKSENRQAGNKFRNHCLVVLTLALIILLAVKLGTNALIGRVDHEKSAGNRPNVDYRLNQATWDAYIRELEADPIYQKILKEKQLFALKYPTQ